MGTWSDRDDEVLGVDGEPPAERTHHWRVGVDVSAELPVAPRVLERHVRARAWPVGGDEAMAKPVPIVVMSGPRTHGLHASIERHDPSDLHIHPRTRWPADHYVEVTVDGQYAPAGSGPIGGPVRTRFRVMKGAEAEIRCSEDFGDGCGPGGIAVTFAMPVPPKDLARVRITPRPPHTTVHTTGDQSV
jgi:hypothetical protein